MAPNGPRDEVVLIGPHRAGKSTPAALLGERRRLSFVSLDAVEGEHVRTLGLDVAETAQLRVRSRRTGHWRR